MCSKAGSSLALLTDCRRHISEALSKAEGSSDPQVVGKVAAALALHHDHARAEFAAVGREPAASAPCCLAPASGWKANLRFPALIEDRLPLPGSFLLSDPARAGSMHQEAGLSARQIASRLVVSHSAVLAASGKLGIARDDGRNGHVVKGQVPFGWDIQDARLVKNSAEQQAIGLIRQLQGGRESLHGIAREFNRPLVPTKNAGLWQANTVAKILRRAAARFAS